MLRFSLKLLRNKHKKGIHQYFKYNKVEVNNNLYRCYSSNDDEKSISQLTDAYRNILEGIGEDPAREGLVKTPSRAAKAMKYFTSGYKSDIDTVINQALFTENHDEMIIVRDIEFYSLCEHHMVPFHGKVHIAYIPKGKVLGLSKVARLVEMFSRRLQLQERLTKQISNSIEEIIDPAGVAVVIEATHMCMTMRGVEKTLASTVTSCVLGDFKHDLKTRTEFFNLLNTNGFRSNQGIYNTYHPRNSNSNENSSSCNCKTQHVNDVSERTEISSLDTQATIKISKEDIKFSSGHFTIFSETERETLHGHNFNISCEVKGRVNENGMITNYQTIKNDLRCFAKELDEKFLLPSNSPFMKIVYEKNEIKAVFNEEVLSFPSTDALLLPVRNITGEELAKYITHKMASKISNEYINEGIEHIKIGISSNSGQEVFHEIDLNNSVLDLSEALNTEKKKKIAVIVGGSSGIGSACIDLFLKKGFKVCNISRREAKQPGVFNISLDLSKELNEEEFKNVINPFISKRNEIHLIHCAGTMAKDSIKSTSYSSLSSSMNVNVVNPALISKLLLPYMKKQSSIIYLSSTLGEKAIANKVSYCASKHAVVGLMKSTAQDLFGEDIHTACICPGFTNTEIVREAIQGKEDEFKEFIGQFVSSGRMIEPYEIAEFIMNVTKSPILNGSVLHANMGQKEV